MTVQITRWQPVRHQGNVIAAFNFQLGDFTVRAALFQRSGSRYSITMPFTQHVGPDGRQVTAVGLPYARVQEVLSAATAYYVAAGDDMAGVRRVVRADVAEAMERAGL